MKNTIKYCLLLLLTSLYSCDDPYKDTTYQVYDVEPAASYLESRSDEFSEWIKVLKYADLFNAINQADDAFTVLAPTNAAMQNFYARKKVSSIEELGQSYARGLAQYHIMNDSIQRDEFVKGGELPAKTLSGDVLEVTFDENSGDGGFNSVYINKESRVKEFSISTANGLIYVLDDVLSPAIETVYERLCSHADNTIQRSAIELTGWKDMLNIVADTFTTISGRKIELKRKFTLLAVSDDVYKKNGISSVEELISHLGADKNYTNKDNLLNKYVAYHILEGGYKLGTLQSFEKDLSQKLWSTKADNYLLMISRENGEIYLNYDESNVGIAQFVEEISDEPVKNGYIQQIDGYLPISKTLKQVPFYFDFCNYPEISSYIASYGADGQVYQQRKDDKEGATAIGNTQGTLVPCFEMKMGPAGTIATGWSNVEYHTAHKKNEYAWWNMLYYDQLIINLGYNGSLTMTTPPIIAGKYKVTLGFNYASSMNFMRLAGDVPDEGSNGGLTSFTFDDNVNKSVSKAIYTAVPSNLLDCYKVELFRELDFTTTQEHKLQLVVLDPAASTHSKFRLQLDYLFFEPIN